VPLGTVVGYPHGANAARIKLAEARRALTEGAVELLLWGNLGLLKAADIDAYRSDLAGVIGLAHMNGALVRVALELDDLSDAEAQVTLAQAVQAGADGAFAVCGAEWDGAALNNLPALIEAAGGQIPVGAMGAVKRAGDLDALIEIGCSRIGLPPGLLKGITGVD
jgi:deoxyribose-phosphate aldolase